MNEIKNNQFSLVIPIYNEENNIEELYKRILNAQKDFTNKFEIIFVNDGSKDRSLEIMHSLSNADKHVKIVDLSRNFGHQIAIKAGLGFAKSDAVIVMDADLQDPPEVIPELVKKWKEGYFVVYAIRKSRKENFILRTMYFLFYRILRVMSKIEIPPDSGDFCLLDKKVVEELVAMKERSPFIRGLRSWVGYKQIGVAYERQARFAGKPKYNFFKLLKLGLDGIFSFSDIPLRVALILGFAVSIVSLLFIINLVISRLPVPGTTLIAVLVLFLGGVQLITIGILGEYIARIYEETKNRRVFIVKETTNL